MLILRDTNAESISFFRIEVADIRQFAGILSNDDFVVRWLVGRNILRRSQNCRSGVK